MIPVAANPFDRIKSPSDLAPLPGPEIFEGLETMGVAYDGQSFPSSGSPVFAELVAKHRPRTIIEVGSWKGVSAKRWLELAGPECHIYCVDTWLSAADAMVQKVKDYAEPRQNGHLMVYWTFLNNMRLWNLHRQVTPIVNTSSIGSDVLKAHGVSAPLIFIDGDHSYRQCYADLCDYWGLLQPGGSMLVDDFRGYPGVYSACLRFIEEYGLWRSHRCVDNNVFCLLEKPL